MKTMLLGSALGLSVVMSGLVVRHLQVLQAHNNNSFELKLSSNCPQLESFRNLNKLLISNFPH